MNKRRDDDKREIVRKGLLLSDVRAAVLGDTGLVAGPKRFDATFLDVPVPFGQAIEVVKLFADARALPPGSEITLKGRTVNTPFESKLAKTGAGRIEVKLDGLIFEDEAQVRQLIDTFKGPALKALSLDGRVRESRIRIRLGPKGVER